MCTTSRAAAGSTPKRPLWTVRASHSRSLKILIEGLARDGKSSLWLTPLQFTPNIMRLFPFDFAYLDGDLRAIEGIALPPGVPLPHSSTLRLQARSFCRSTRFPPRELAPVIGSSSALKRISKRGLLRSPSQRLVPHSRCFSGRTSSSSETSLLRTSTIRTSSHPISASASVTSKLRRSGCPGHGFHSVHDIRLADFNFHDDRRAA